MLRGRCSSAIPARPGTSTGTQTTRPIPSPAFQPPLSPLFPLHPGNPPVTPLFPLHTQKQGAGAHLPQDVFFPNSFVFSRRSNYMLNYMNNYIVGAPTFVTLLTTTSTPKNRSEDRPLHKKKHGPPQKDGPYTNCELSTVNCEQDSPKHAFYREIIKYVEAPTFWSAAAGRRFCDGSTATKVSFFAGLNGPPPSCGGRAKGGPYNGKMAGALYVAAARDRLGARSGVRTEIPGSLLRRT